MAVGTWKVGGALVGMRAFPAPKRAGELKYWWLAARRAIPSMPKFEARGTTEVCDLTPETIIMSGNRGGIPWELIVARKKTL